MPETSSIWRRVAAGAIAAAGAVSGYTYIVRPWHTRWGATEEELKAPMPGDDLVPEPKSKYTHAITIQTPPREVWPWLVQIGQGRGGLYSYDRLENLIGSNIHSADRIVPELQHLAVGDVVRLGPEGYPYFTVVAIEPEQALVLQGGSPGETPQEGAPFFAGSWVFLLSKPETGTTRLVTRQRIDWNPSLMNAVGFGVFLEMISFVMEQKMLRGIKQRAEQRSA